MSAPAPVTKPEAGLPVARDRRAPAAASMPQLPTDPRPNGEGLRADQWLYLLDGAQRGPIDIEDLIDLVLTSIPESTKVWHPGLDGWVLANRVRQIADEIPPPIPAPGVSRGVYGDEEMPDFNTVPPMLRSVLIADEDAAFRKYLAMPLAAQGFTIFEAADGSAAWQLAVQNRPWLILADISMPELDGFEFCRRVRNHPMLSRLPLLFISGSDKYKERYRALQIGADDFLSKNMPIRELLMRIQLLMTRYSDLSGGEQKPGTTDVAGAFQGRIEVFGAPALLQMCAQGRLTGLFTALAEDAANTATVMGLREGDIISATVGSTSGVDAVYAFLAWTKGSFKFTPGDPGEGEPLAQSVEHLLLEGCRLLDEANKGGSEGAALAEGQGSTRATGRCSPPRRTSLAATQSRYTRSHRSWYTAYQVPARRSSPRVAGASGCRRDDRRHGGSSVARRDRHAVRRRGGSCRKVWTRRQAAASSRPDAVSCSRASLTTPRRARQTSQLGSGPGPVGVPKDEAAVRFRQ
jgi:CheY-like chemotaxis protein